MIPDPLFGFQIDQIPSSVFLYRSIFGASPRTSLTCFYYKTSPSVREAILFPDKPASSRRPADLLRRGIAAIQLIELVRRAPRRLRTPRAVFLVFLMFAVFVVFVVSWLATSCSSRRRASVSHHPAQYFTSSTLLLKNFRR